MAYLYGVETRSLIQAVKRNVERFPTHFMFQLAQDESDSLRSQIVISKGKDGHRYLPYAFTEQGIAMLSSVPKYETGEERLKAFELPIWHLKLEVTNCDLKLWKPQQGFANTYSILEII